MSNTTYTPTPVNLDSVTLPEGLEPLREQIAEHVHDEWAVLRISQGWTHGEKRDDEKKHHPCLVAYADLPDSEREYDRKTAEGTLKIVVSMGYQLTKCDD